MRVLSQLHPPVPEVLSRSQAHPPVERLGTSGAVLATIGAIVSLLYLINPSLGIFEFLPDKLPLIGNLDELFFALLLVECLRKLNIRLPSVLATVLPTGQRLSRAR